MTTPAQLETKYLSRLVKAAAALKELEAKVDALEREKREPIAIVGLACRFPGGADTPQHFWQLLDSGVDAVEEVPPERRFLDVTAAAKESRRGPFGAFLKDVDGFDAPFFGISPREAAKLDPQQRLLLEVAWETLENAGIAPDQLQGTRTGVFIGMTGTDYQTLCTLAGAQERDAYVATGNGHCFPPGRLSYFLGLMGPSLAVDTACSSSLVAVHLACQSLRSGESSLVLAGGVNLMLAEETTRLIEELQALSYDGRCKTFDAGANGFVRGEGCALVALKRLSDAVAAGDPILAVIRGSAVNQDGRSAGLTAPNVLAQQAMLRQALASAGVSAREIDYVETHGTGTALGDPLEVDALVDVFGTPRADGSVCSLGAVKTNIGHLEAAAGIAGLIKVVLSLQYGAIPANLHFQTLNPRISLNGTPLVIASEKRPWPAGERVRRAGVSAFGMSGTNAHVILEEAPGVSPAAPAKDERGLVVLPLSARTPQALAELARAYESLLAQGELHSTLAELALTAGARRSHHEQRLAVIADSQEEVADALRAFRIGEPRPQLIRGRAATGGRAKVVFVFSGQGSQWLGMGLELLRGQSAFRTTFETCDALVKRYAGFSLLEELARPEASSRLDETEIAQPAIFALQVSLAALLSSYGIIPDAVIGHSVGEVAAARIAGVLSLEDAARLVAIRGRIMQRATGDGKMVAVALNASEAAHALVGCEDRLSIAAINDSSSVVLAGEARALEEAVQRLEQRSVRCRFLRVNYAFHSPQMAPLQSELAAALEWLKPRRATLPMYSTARGCRVDGTELDAAYWANSIRDTVKFATAVAAASAEGQRIFVEIGPHPVLLGSLELCLAERKSDGAAVTTLRRGQDALRCVFSALGTLYAHGCGLDFQKIHPTARRVAALPTYPWQRQRYWLKFDPEDALASGVVAGHPLLGRRLRVAGARAVFEKIWSAPTRAVNQGPDDPNPVSDGCMTELLSAAVAAAFGAQRASVSAIALHAPLRLAPGERRRVQIAISAAPDTAAPITVYSQDASAKLEERWIIHATGQVSADGTEAVPAEEAGEFKAQLALTRRMEQAALQWIERLRGLQPAAWAAEIETAVRADLASVLLLPTASDIAATVPVQELGMDSLMAVQLRHELSARLGRSLPPTLVFEYPTIQALTNYLLDLVVSSDALAGEPSVEAELRGEL